MKELFDIFAPEVDFITYVQPSDVHKAIKAHYVHVSGKTEEEFEEYVNTTYQNKRKLKLIDGTYFTKALTINPYAEWLQANVKIVIDELKPDTWTTEHEEYDMPDFLRVPIFGIYHAGKPEEYASGEKLHRVKEVFDKLGIKAGLHCVDCAPGTFPSYKV